MSKIKLYASAASSWRKCPGVLDFASGRNIFQERTSADRGDKFHEICEKFLKFIDEPNYPAALKKAKLDEENLGDEDFYERGKLVWGRIKSDWIEAGKGKKLIIEHPFQLPLGSKYEISGRLDIALIDSKTANIYDIKTGWIEVEAKGNEQLRITAQVLKKNRVIKDQEIFGTILQTSLMQVDTDKIEIDPHYFYDLEKVLSQKKKPLRIGAQCRFCQVADICPEFDRNLKELMKPKYLDVSINRVDRWKEILKISKPIRKALEQIERNALEAAKKGIEIPGFKLETKNAQRSWNHRMRPANLAKFLGLKEDTISKVSLQTPAFVERLIKKEKFKERFTEVVNQSGYFQLKQDGEGIFKKRDKEKKIEKQKKTKIDSKKPKKTKGRK